MSAPSRDAATRSANPAQRSTAAASAEPPPSPPPWGIALCTCTAAVRPASRSARLTRFDSSSGIPPANGPSAVSPLPSGAIVSRVGQIERHHLGVDEVVPVVAHAGDAQAQRQLRRRQQLDHGPIVRPSSESQPDDAGGATPRRGGRWSGGPIRRRRAPPAGGWRRCRRRRTLQVQRHRRASGGASCGAGRTRCARAGTGRPAAASVGGVSRRTISTSADSTFGRGTNTLAGTRPTMRARRPVRDLHADRAVGGRARRGAQPLADLALDHHQHPRDRGHAVEQVGDERRGHVVGQVGHERANPSSSPSTVDQSRRSASPSTTRVAGPVEHVAQHRHQAAVDLDGRHRRAGLDQRQRQRADAGTDLHHPVAGPDTGQAGDAPHGVRVGDEVLPEVAPGSETVGVQQLVDAGAAVHGATR